MSCCPGIPGRFVADSFRGVGCEGKERGVPGLVLWSAEHVDNLLPGFIIESSVQMFRRVLMGMKKTRSKDGRIRNREI